MGRADYSRRVRANPLAVGLLTVLSGATACRSFDVGVPVLVQPGAPGEATRAISPANATDVSRTSATAADVRFMQDMITHHAQAVEMTALLRTRTARADMRLLGARIEASQQDEMAFMRRWLQARGHTAPDSHAHHEHGATLMPGMLTPEEMARLATATEAEFDRLFLEGMIKHHAGALEMVASLFASPGAGQDTEIFAFASDVDADQRIEIARMEGMWLDVTSQGRRP
jgi:uncharacterized protein (DUF305 family)